MEILFVLIPVSVLMAAGFTVACLRAIREGQFDDMESPRWRVLFEHGEAAAPEKGRKTGEELKRSEIQ